MATLGDVLYARPARPIAPEAEWVALLHLIAAGDRLSVRELYTRMHGVVFQLITQITGDRRAAEDLTLELFHDLPRRAARYDAAGGTVVAWIMNEARTRAIDWLRMPQRSVPETDLFPPGTRRSQEPPWEDVAPGIAVKILAADRVKHVVSMQVRLEPGGEYPAHTHAGVEELHLLEGELWIDDRKLHPGDYNRAEQGTSDARVWSETGCACVLITSTRDILA
jgi:anti-sigma factor ChrR (cupin superfamily)